MRLAPTRGQTRQASRTERGYASLETVGVVMIASILAVSLLIAVTPQARILAEHFSYAICQVVTFGQGGCTPPTTTPDAHEPTEPCVLTQNGVERNTKISVIVFTAADGRRIEVQRLSNGEYKVTVTDTGGVGLETGVGGGLSITVNDTTVGGNASANAGVELTINAGETYYTDQDGIDNLMDALLRDQVKDTIAGDSGIVRWFVDRGEELIGADNDLPTPDETFAEGGISLNASAEATAGLSSASAGVDAAQVLGVRTNRDGTTTVYLKSTVSGEAGFSSLGYDTDSLEFQGADLSGEVEVVTAVTFDSEGNMVSVQASAAVSGSSSGMTNALFGGDYTENLGDQISGARIYQATLDINSDADRDVANQFLLAQGVTALGGWQNPLLAAGAIYANHNFFEAALSRGVVTQQDYDTDSTTVLGVDASAELGVELGVSASVEEDSMQITDASYWDGTRWVEWEACSA